jgi:excinuclease UvrABC ATPase subunit
MGRLQWVVVIDHTLDEITSADWIVGPGAERREIIAQGSSDRSEEY